jgi:hypothetical protein
LTPFFRVDDGGQTAQRIVLVVGAVARWAGDGGQLPVLVPLKVRGALQRVGDGDQASGAIIGIIGGALLFSY